MGYKLPLVNLQNVSPGNTATLKVDCGPGAPTFDQIKLVLGGGMLPSHLTFVRGKANGRIFLDETGGGTVINSRDAYKNVTVSAGMVVIDFTERNSRNGAAEQLVAALPACLLQSLTFEIGIAAGAPAIGTITAFGNYRPPTKNPFIRKLLTTNQTFTAAGTAGAPNVMYLPVGGSGGKIKRIWIRESAANLVTAVQIRIANAVIFDTTRASFENDQVRNLLVPQSQIAVIDFIEDGNLAGMLDTSAAPSVLVNMTTSAAGTYNIDYELVDPISRL